MLSNRHTHTQTHTQTKYCNPRCACAPRVNETIRPVHRTRPRTNSLEGCVELQHNRQSVLVLQALWLCLVHLLSIVAMHTESIIYSRHYSKVSSDFFDPQCCLLSVFNTKSDLHTRSERISRLLVFHPKTSVRIASHASSFGCIKGDYTYVLQI